jgi:hypothetical protein
LPGLPQHGRTEVLLVDVASGTAVESVGRQGLRFVGRQQDHHGRRGGREDAAGGLDPVDARQVDVHQHHRRADRERDLDRLVS